MMSEKKFEFSRQHRLRKKADFNFVFERPRKITGQRLILLFRPNLLGYFRIGMMLSKAKMKQAVARNRVKRLIRETFRQHRQVLAGFDIVIMLRSRQESDMDKAGHDKLLRNDIKYVCEKLMQ